MDTVLEPYHTTEGYLHTYDVIKHHDSVMVRQVWLDRCEVLRSTSVGCFHSYISFQFILSLVEYKNA